MPRWLPKVLTRIRRRAAARKVSFTLKARQELAGLQGGLDEEDARDVLVRLSSAESAGRLASTSTGEWMYLFKPRISATVVYVKVVLEASAWWSHFMRIKTAPMK